MEKADKPYNKLVKKVFLKKRYFTGFTKDKINKIATQKRVNNNKINKRNFFKKYLFSVRINNKRK